MDTLCVYFLYKGVENDTLNILCWRAPKKLKISRQDVLNPNERADLNSK